MYPATSLRVSGAVGRFDLAIGANVSRAFNPLSVQQRRHRRIQARLRQGAFRVLVTDSYDRRCALSGERTLPVLQAAHIKPYAEGGLHQVPNGILLRSDIHVLFDAGDRPRLEPAADAAFAPRLRRR